jgi:hypothetical protein
MGKKEKQSLEAGRYVWKVGRVEHKVKKISTRGVAEKGKRGERLQFSGSGEREVHLESPSSSSPGFLLCHLP